MNQLALVLMCMHLLLNSVSHLDIPLEAHNYKRVFVIICLQGRYWMSTTSQSGMATTHETYHSRHEHTRSGKYPFSLSIRSRLGARM